MTKDVQWAISRLLKILHPGFYGSFTINFQAGKVCAIRHEEIEKPDPSRLTVEAP